MARMSAHYLNNLHPPVRAGRRARAFEYLCDIAQRGVKSERVISAREILVNSFGHADDVQPRIAGAGRQAGVA